MLTRIRADARSRRRTRLAAVAGSVAAAAAIWLVAVPLLGVDLEVARWDGDVTMTVTPAHVITTALVAALAAWGALAVLETVARRAARRIWLVAALVVLVVSLVMPVTAARTTAAVVALELMHVAVGAVLITAVPGRAR